MAAIEVCAMYSLFSLLNTFLYLAKINLKSKLKSVFSKVLKISI